uniref:phosphoserine phosphatase n=1 Tax=Kalanchoe fedtschenkoi TaxID=63787 RepID=A0A7N0ZRF2_KALFE
MEGLMRTQISQAGSQFLQQQTYPSLGPTFGSRVGRLFYRSSVIMRNQQSYSSSNSVAASVKPLEASSVGHFDNTLPTREVLDLWQSTNAVCFDVDSTVCLDEGIDELAEFCGAGQAVAEWTARAMSGSVSFEEALAARLALFNPSLSQVQDFLEKRPPRLSPGIDELVKTLKENGNDVYLISGGFRQMINPVASILGIPRENIFANNLLFGDYGEFKGFDVNEPTSRSGGKATAVRNIRKSHDYKTLAMIGDGATDLEARQPGGADLFICYGGVQLREGVAANADWLVFNFKDLINSLK